MLGGRSSLGTERNVAPHRAYTFWSMTTASSRLGLLMNALGCGGLALGCGADPAATGPSSATDSSNTDTDSTAGARNGDETGETEGDTDGGSGGGGRPEFPPPGPPGGDACPELTCLPCGVSERCAEAGPYLGTTCCAAGDPLVHRGRGSAAEAVDVVVADGVAFLCGGFGVVANDVSDPDDPRVIVGAASRCQHAAIGPTLADGQRVFWLAHHGDTWVETPFLSTYTYDPSPDELGAQERFRLEDPNVLFEGIAYHEGFVYAAVHSRGVHAYRVEDDLSLSLASVTEGFDNATRLVVEGERLLVADQLGGVKVLSLEEPATPRFVTTLSSLGMARDVAAHGDLAVVALGGGGVDVFDLSNEDVAQVGHIDVAGTAQAVDVDDEVIAIAAWTHVALHDRDSLQLLATERVRNSPQFEQDLGIALEGDLVHVAEWEGHHVLQRHNGLVAPDIWVEEDLIEFAPQESGDRAIVVRNRGYLDLDVREVSVDSGTLDQPFSVDTTRFRVPPQRASAFELSYTPGGASAGPSPRVILDSNDPDVQQSPLVVPIQASASDRIDVGDELTAEFGFLDPSGMGSVDGLRGHVTVLAYFALF